MQAPRLKLASLCHCSSHLLWLQSVCFHFYKIIFVGDKAFLAGLCLSICMFNVSYVAIQEVVIVSTLLKHFAHCGKMENR